jgi:hypothetical protein
VVLWEASDRLCGKRLKVMIPVLLPVLERHGRVCMTEAERGAGKRSGSRIRAKKPINRRGAGAHCRRNPSSGADNATIPEGQDPTARQVRRTSKKSVTTPYGVASCDELSRGGVIRPGVRRKALRERR